MFMGPLILRCWGWSRNRPRLRGGAVAPALGAPGAGNPDQVVGGAEDPVAVKGFAPVDDQAVVGAVAKSAYDKRKTKRKQVVVVNKYYNSKPVQGYTKKRNSRRK